MVRPPLGGVSRKGTPLLESEPPRPVFDPEAQTRRELGAEGRSRRPVDPHQQSKQKRLWSLNIPQPIIINEQFKTSISSPNKLVSDNHHP